MEFFDRLLGMALVQENALANWSAHIRDVRDFPKPGVVFKDITPLLANPEAFRMAVDEMAVRFSDAAPDAVAAAEARGFMFAAPMAYNLGIPFIPLRKPGKLPWKTRSVQYDLEYGQAELHMHEDAVTPGSRVLLVDDLLATGGTAAAMIDLIRGVGAIPIGFICVVELGFLNPRKALPPDFRVESLFQVDSE